MSLDGYVEVGQDGVGVIEVGGTAKGLYTCNVETCYVAIFLCMKATIFLHDSGQLKMNQIQKFVGKYGSVRKIIIIRRTRYADRQDKRIDRLVKAIGAKRDDVAAQYEPFAVACAASGAYQVLDNNVPEGVIRLPEFNKRLSVCEVNNMFIEPGSQSLSLDIQFQRGEHSEARGVDKPLPEMLETVRVQREHFFQNVAVLGKAQENGLLELPENLWAIYERLNLAQFRTRGLNDDDKAEQVREHRAYLDLLATV